MGDEELGSALAVNELHPRAVELLEEEFGSTGVASGRERDPMSIGCTWMLGFLVSASLFVVFVDTAPEFAAVVGVMGGLGIVWAFHAHRTNPYALRFAQVSALSSSYRIPDVLADDQLYLATAVGLAQSADLTFDEGRALLKELNGLYDELLRIPVTAPIEPETSATILPQLVRERDAETDPGIRAVLEESIALEESRLVAVSAAITNQRRLAAQRRLLYQAIDAVADLAQHNPTPEMPVSMVVERVASIRQRVTAESDARKEVDALRFEAQG